MTDFSVWAPAPDRVRLWTSDATAGGERGAGGERVHPMTRGDDGWWRVSDPDALGTTGSYAYLLGDDDTPIPDPRSRRQPGGVHRPSQVFDPSDYAWADDDWTGRQLAGSVVYELHVGTFTPLGTFDAAIDKLGYLADLGIDFVEPLPVNAFNGSRGWGYDGVLWYAIHEPYGGPAGYQRFVDACHSHGLGVIQDVVYNHLGPSGNYLPRFGPYLSGGPGNTWGDSINLDGPGSDDVRRYIIDNALMWLGDYHVDGLRLDAVHALRDSRATHILEELAVEVEALQAAVRRPLTLIAESDLNDPRLITDRAAGGYGVDGQWSDDFHHAVHVAVTGETDGYYADFEPFGALAKVLHRGFFHDGTYSSFRGRHHGRPIDRLRTPSSRLVVCTQDHDQIGNRAAGDRLCATLGADEFRFGKLAVAAVLNLSGPFTPMLFMGEEWGASTPWQFFTSHPEPELAAATAEGRLREFARMGWDPAIVPDPQAETTFTDSRLDWAEPNGGEHAGLLDLYRKLIAARRRLPGLTDPRFSTIEVDHDSGERWLLLRRPGAVVAANLSGDERVVPLTAGPEPEKTGAPGAQSTPGEPAMPELLNMPGTPGGPGPRIEVATTDGVRLIGGNLLLPAWSAAVLTTPPPRKTPRRAQNAWL